MAEFVGRQVGLAWNAVTLVGVRDNGVTLNGEPIDVTSGEDSGVRKLLDTSATDSVDLSLSGVSKDHVLRDDWFAGTRTRPTVYTFADGSTITGDFVISAYSENAAYTDAITFDVTLQSTGAFAYVAAA